MFTLAARAASLPVPCHLLSWGQESLAYWSADVPDQVGDPDGIKFQIWEQVTYAFKLIKSQMAVNPRPCTVSGSPPRTDKLDFGLCAWGNGLSSGRDIR
jgi:hypothetical protein